MEIMKTIAGFVLAGFVAALMTGFYTAAYMSIF